MRSHSTRIQGEAGSIIDSRSYHSGQTDTAILLCYFGMSLLFGRILPQSSTKPLFIYLTSFFKSCLKMSLILKVFPLFLLLDKIGDQFIHKSSCQHCFPSPFLGNKQFKLVGGWSISKNCKLNGSQHICTPC